MAVPFDSGPLPDYADPPVVETVLGIQFKPLSRLTNAHLGAFWRSLPRDQWPNVKDALLLPPQFERFDAKAQWARGIQLHVTQDPASRLQIKNAAGDRMIQIQNTRLHFNWIKKPDLKYPRYEAVRDEFSAVLAHFIEFVKGERLEVFCPNQWEVTYVNEIPQGTVWNAPRDWRFFRLLGDVADVADVIEAESFGGEWHFVIPHQRGRLHIQWQHRRKSGDGRDARAQEFIRLTLTARGPVSESSDGIGLVVEGLNLGRETIVRTFRSLMSPEANNSWGLKT